MTVLPTSAAARAPTRVPGTPGRAPVAAAEALEVRLEGVGRAFGVGGQRRQVLRGVDLRIEAGEVVALLGPSGCGKSTLLRVTAGLDQPTSGRVLVGDQVVSGIESRCAVAFQEPRLLPWRTLRHNVALGLPPGTGRREGDALVDELLALVGLAEHAGHRPREVSGGMAQRTSLARALARRPGVLLLDEPFGALDALTRMKMQDLLLDVRRASPTTVLLVTHDVDEALQLADRVVVLGRSDDDPAAGVTEVVTVPGERPRDRGSVELAQLRAGLLQSLGVDAHRH